MGKDYIMSIPGTDKTGQGKISPPPIHERIINNNIPTQALVRYFLDLRKSGFNVYDEIDRVIDFANNIQVGAGLEEDGIYSPDTLAKYISLATSLKNADSLLDEAIWDYTREAISTVTGDTSLLAFAQTVLVNAATGEADIKMPNPADCFENNRSLRIAVSKIDTTANLVNILPFGAELIVGETSQSINCEGDILNFITNGTNWYLQS
jgi:hypothetical protein